MKDDKVYRKADNGRYIPFGICCQPDHMQDGIWYVRHGEGSRTTTSVGYMAGLFKMGDSKTIDVTKLCGMEDLCDEIMNSKEFNEVINRKEGHSISDML